MVMEFKPELMTKEILMAALGISALIILFSTKYNIVVVICLFVLALWIYTMTEPIIEQHKDRKERWRLAQKSYGGIGMPDYEKILSTLDYHLWETEEKSTAFYGFINPELSIRESYVIDGDGTILDQNNAKTRRMDYGTWFSDARDKALGVIEKKTDQQCIERVRQLGYRLRWVGKKKIPDQVDEEDNS
jgi:hypothetical protein